MKKNIYLAPQITVVSFRAERGYAESGNIADMLNPEAMNEIALGLAEGQLNQDVAGNPMEDYEYRTGWYKPDEGTNSFF